MIQKELKRLSRKELVDIIYQLKKNEQELEEEISLLKKEIEDKRIRLSEVGTIAEAALSVTDIFSEAQKTADIYLSEISALKEEAEKERQQRLSETEEVCKQKLVEAEEECQKRLLEAEEKVKAVFAEGEKKFALLKEAYMKDYEKWQELNEKIAALKEKEGFSKGEEDAK